MDATKPTLSSKTVVTNLVLAVLNAFVFFGVLSADLGIGAEETAGGLAIVNALGNLVSAYFRKVATARLR